VTIYQLAMSASDLARAAILESVPSEHVGAVIDVVALDSDDANVSIALHTFEAKSPGYPGWYWAVAVIAIDGQEYCTVSEINLLPGTDALVPSSWTPWSERVQAGDLDVGDLLPTDENDERLTAGFTGLDELAEDLAPLHPVQWEMGLGREQILSTIGLERAVARWFAGDTGPRAAMAKAAPANCGSCGFLTPIGGSLGQVFGICANEFGAADGQLVATTFGCGAHSSVRADTKAPIPVVPLVIDDDSDERSDASEVGEYLPEVAADVVLESADGEELSAIAGDSETETVVGSESDHSASETSDADAQPDLVVQNEFQDSETESVDSAIDDVEQGVDFATDIEASSLAEDPVED